MLLRDMIAPKRKLYKYTLFSSVNLSVISVLILYYLNLALIIKAFSDYQGAFEVVLIISLRIVILSITAFYLFNKWFKQEAMYLSDIPFLLGLFFLILIFGKA
ncbi:MAG: hypothetical protein ACFFA6_08745, partial [Promethearchaeota archaeon]